MKKPWQVAWTASPDDWCDRPHRDGRPRRRHQSYTTFPRALEAAGFAARRGATEIKIRKRREDQDASAMTRDPRQPRG